MQDRKRMYQKKHTMAEEHGYRNLKEIIAAKETIKSGDKVYADNMGKAIVLLT